MLVTLNWLKDFVEIDIPVIELSSRLTMMGLEVVATKDVGLPAALKDKVLLAKTVDVKPHPKSPKLKVCKVKSRAGTHEVVTNCEKIEKNDYVVVALPGTKLPDGFEVKETDIKGVVSQGMLIALQHLSIEPKSADIWLLGKDDKRAEETFATYAEQDVVIELELTANRSDCLSVIGVAREVAAMLDRDIELEKIKIEETLDEEPNVQILDKTLCPRYTARVMRGVNVAESPEWIKRRLTLCGIRAINNLVDATNYVQLEYGHPTHAFDLNQLDGAKVIVRKAKKGEEITTLDGAPQKLEEGMLVIADEAKPVALAGVMGGANSEISSKTHSVLLESAFFDPISIRRTAKVLGIRTESSYRFERTADWGITPTALDRIVQLVKLTSPGQVSRTADLYPSVIKDKVIGIDNEYVSENIGVQFTIKQVEDFLKRLDFVIMVKRENSIEVKVPTFRSDISQPIDLVEEVARVYGYNSIPEAPFKPAVDPAHMNAEKTFKEVIRSVLQGAGFTEVYNLSFINEADVAKFKLPADKAVPLANPMTADATHLRTDVFPGMMKTMEMNNKSAYVTELRLFEFGSAFRKHGKDFEERPLLGIALSGSKESYYTLFGAAEAVLKRIGAGKLTVEKAAEEFLHPANSAVIRCGRHEVGWIGEVHPDIYESMEIKYPVFAAQFDASVLDAIYREPYKIESFPRFPPVRRDLSVVVDKAVMARDVLNTIAEHHEWIEVEFTDVFTGDKLGDKVKSLTYSLVFKHPSKTLNDAEVGEILDELIADLKKKYGAELRS